MSTTIYTVTMEITPAPDGQNALAEADLKAKAESAMTLVMTEGTTKLVTTVVEQ